MRFVATKWLISQAQAARLGFGERDPNFVLTVCGVSGIRRRHPLILGLAPVLSGDYPNLSGLTPVSSVSAPVLS